MILSLLFYAFLAYLLYRLVFNFIIPIYRTTKQVKKGFRDMQDQMRQHTAPDYGGRPQSSNTSRQKTSGGKAGDYIEFEEVKD